MFYFNKYQKYFLLIQKNKIQNFKLHVSKFWGNFFIVKKSQDFVKETVALWNKRNR